MQEIMDKVIDSFITKLRANNTFSEDTLQKLDKLLKTEKIKKDDIVSLLEKEAKNSVDRNDREEDEDR